MSDEHGLPTTQEEMRVYLQSALELEDSCLVAKVAQGRPVATQRSPLDEDVVDQAAQILSLLWVNMSERPDLAALMKEQAGSENGEAVCIWQYVNKQKPSCQFLLHVELRTPVHVSFHVAFRLAEWYVLLEAIAQHGEMWFLPGPPIDWQPLIHRLDQSVFLRRVGEMCGSGVIITLERETMRALGQHIKAWKAQFVS
jgi:hypothetical protein